MRRPVRDPTADSVWAWLRSYIEDHVSVRPKGSETARALDAADRAVQEGSTALPADAELVESLSGVGRRWKPENVTRARAPGRDGVPHWDDDLDEDIHAAPRTYPAWLPGETIVVSGPLHSQGGKGRPFTSRRAAREWALEKYGAILEEHMINGRWSLRVPVPGPAGDKHRPKK